MAKKEKASVLAFEKKLAPSDGFLAETVWNERDKAENAKTLSLHEKSVRGTISNRLKSAGETKFDPKVDQPNLQRVDNCMLSMECDTVKLSFSLKVFGNLHKPSTCNHQGFAEAYVKTVKTYIEKEGFRELAKRYAVNLANARFLWRNRVGAEAIEVRVALEGKEAEANKPLTFDAKKFSLMDFNTTDPEVSRLADLIAKALSGENTHLMLKVDAFAKIGSGQEVFPSEELVLDKNTDKAKGRKSKILYHVNNHAALHSQKIGNAIRTIDTWYPDYSDEIGPIAAEVYGAVTNLGTAFRKPKADFFSLFDKYAWGEPLEKKEDEHYVMSVLIRGGVFGESDKD